ncbi:MAG: hypothetical protein IT307_14590 [Chloroflexi bacterium]|nr:hypothetical protein [Chloroflexota bacterium]
MRGLLAGALLAGAVVVASSVTTHVEAAPITVSGTGSVGGAHTLAVAPNPAVPNFDVSGFNSTENFYNAFIATVTSSHATWYVTVYSPSNILACTPSGGGCSDVSLATYPDLSLKRNSAPESVANRVVVAGASPGPQVIGCAGAGGLPNCASGGQTNPAGDPIGVDVRFSNINASSAHMVSGYAYTFDLNFTLF